MTHAMQFCEHCGRTLRPDPAPRGERYPERLVHSDGSEECTTRPGHIGLSEDLLNG
ncbi:hypothetical protein V2J94_41505 [Streptomyces sp. DSM 41524]|uniref:Uncharacterized protein n=1 Tax=Streptomyces asiaticus subsp. ignotus TaxID=3098222 RepID=A0ABU7QA21_9ACTN|nr:hypothetical protein [Streptomyces sp. DSM 41524]